MNLLSWSRNQFQIIWAWPVGLLEESIGSAFTSVTKAWLWSATVQVGRGIGFKVCKAFLRTYYRAAAAAGWSVGRATRSYQNFMLFQVLTEPSERCSKSCDSSDQMMSCSLLLSNCSGLYSHRSSPHCGQSALKLKVLGLQRWCSASAAGNQCLFGLLLPRNFPPHNCRSLDFFF